MDRPFPAYKGDEPYIFVSYSHTNSSAVYRELNWLKECGFNIWYDEGIEAGTEWTDALAEAIQQAKLFVYFVTPESAHSQNCRNEVNFAVEQELPIIAVHLKQTDLPGGLSLTLSSRQAVLKHEIPTDEYQQKLKSRIASYMDQSVAQPIAARQKKTVPVLAGLAVVILLVLGIFFYSQQDKWQTSGAVAESPDEIETIDPAASSAAEEKIDIGAMYSIAVLPFANMSSNEDLGFLADGISEDILDRLAQNRGLKVASRSASFQFKGRGEDPVVIRQELNVAYLLEGSVRQQGDMVRITAQLIRSQDGYHVWSRSYERELGQDFEMQTEVASNIALVSVSKLDVDIQSNYAWKQQSDFRDIDPQAVRYYWMEFSEYNDIHFDEGGDWESRLAYLQKAVEIDPDFYVAHGRLANVYLSLHQQGKIPFSEARPAAYTAITRAIELAPEYLPNSMFFYPQFLTDLELDYAGASDKFNQLLVLDPKAHWALIYLATIDTSEGRNSEALRRIVDLTAVDAGADTVAVMWVLALIRNSAGDPESALDASTKGLKHIAGRTERSLVLWIHALNLIQLKRINEARPFIAEGWKLDRIVAPERYVSLFRYIGDVERAENILSQLDLEAADPLPLALGYLALGDKDNTFKTLLTGIEERNKFIVATLRAGHWWDPIRDDPRFDEMLELLDSKVTHTEQFLRDQQIEQQSQ